MEGYFMTETNNYPDWIKIKECKAVPTFDLDNNENGFLVDLLNKNDDLMKDRTNKEFTQFYMSTMKKGGFKGLHMHATKIDAYCCAFGKICMAIYPEVIVREDIDTTIMDVSKFFYIEFGEGCHKTISLPSKYPHGFFGITEDAVLINYRDPAYDPSDTGQFSIKSEEMLNVLRKKYLDGQEG
jgi:dTDP-4-dehydrorhamnose 3,5-epimerase-like enzyme